MYNNEPSRRKNEDENEGRAEGKDDDRYMISSFGRSRQHAVSTNATGTSTGASSDAVSNFTHNDNSRSRLETEDPYYELFGTTASFDTAGSLNDNPPDRLNESKDPFYELFGDDGVQDEKGEEDTTRIDNDRKDDRGGYYGYGRRMAMVDGQEDDGGDDGDDSQCLSDDSSNDNEEYTSHLFENQYGGSHSNNDSDNFDEEIGLNEAMLESLHTKLMALDKEITFER